MTRRRRLFKIAKWTAATSFVLSLAVWIVAANWLVILPFSGLDDESMYRSIFIGYGAVFAVHTAQPERSEWSGSGTWFRPPEMAGSANTINLVPAWSLPAVTLPLTVLLFIADRRRMLAGYCRRCGYNLTGNVSGVCPECGTPIGT